ncbi:AUGMIN subunit 3 [Glycine soja]|uniref:HAUS augmin-like complex subunit 3 N-terminal domain-containing protein n=2 Tax=Glycine subgen. Soja TaxID=1462606 RepID=A0A0R0INH2_SOYBN|nr:AUGMIN subunit 3 [Glycine soja]
MNGVLERIASKAHELAHYHSGDEDGIYLAYSDFNQFLLGDSSCLKELNQWFAKQLDTGKVCIDITLSTPCNSGSLMHFASFFVGSFHPVPVDYDISISDCLFAFVEVKYVI